MTIDDLIDELEEIRRQTGHGFRSVVVHGYAIDGVSIQRDEVVLSSGGVLRRFAEWDESEDDE